ncbi:hypothetical protein VLK31_21215 [Variovorax sp. H27-G14]|uniref:hypothetical protein n=1 Tax=Variovorax sp. H27-G14 TaxID=3111914 RepID=UPI0038FD20DC
MLVGLAPVALWLLLLSVADGLMPWSAAFAVVLWIPLCSLSLLISGSGSAVAVARRLSRTDHQAWRGIHRLPSWTAAMIALLAAFCAVYVLLPAEAARKQPPAISVQLSPEADEELAQQTKKKIEEVTGKPYLPNGATTKGMP